MKINFITVSKYVYQKGYKTRFLFFFLLYFYNIFKYNIRESPLHYAKQSAHITFWNKFSKIEIIKNGQKL